MKNKIKRATLTLIISATLVASTALTIKYFNPSNTAYYYNSSGQCVSLVVANATPFDTKGTNDAAATILTKDGLLRPLYIDNTCTTPATFKP